MIELYKQSDTEAYLKGEKTFIGFTTQNFINTNFVNNGINTFNSKIYGSDINSFVDLYTSLIPFCATTKPGNKLYSIVLNPDFDEDVLSALENSTDLIGEKQFGY
jgi:hypothetical protein